MATRYFGFDSSGGDRTYIASDYMRWMDINGWGSYGVVSGWGSNLAVTSSVGFQTTIATGAATEAGMTFEVHTASENLAHDSVPSGYKRYDYVVVRFDASSTRSAFLYVIKGVETTGTAVVPSLGTYDVPLATYYINNATGTPAFTLADARVYKTVTKDSVTLNTLTSAQSASGFKFKNIDLGSVSGTVTIPNMEVGEFLTVYIVRTVAGNTNLPASGTYHVSGIISSGNSVLRSVSAGSNISLGTNNTTYFILRIS